MSCASIISSAKWTSRWRIERKKSKAADEVAEFIRNLSANLSGAARFELKLSFSFVSRTCKIPPRLQMDNIIEARQVQIERKYFHVELRENDRGKFLRITEEAHGRRNTIIVPSTGVGEFTAAIGEVLANSDRLAAS